MFLSFSIFVLTLPDPAMAGALCTGLPLLVSLFFKVLKYPNYPNYTFVESPFEFRALEVALEAICSFLAARTTELETEAYPALDDLTYKVSTFGWCS